MIKDSLLPLAKHLDAAARNCELVEQLSLSQELTLDDAYELQAASIGERLDRGEELVGYKLGFTSKAKMEQMGVHELIWGRLTDAMQLHPGEDMKMDRFIHPRAEPEIAFRISREISRPIPVSEAKEYYDAVAVAIEFIDSRYKDFKFSLEDVVADNCSSSGFIIGAWQSPGLDVRDLPMQLNINGETVQSGSSSAILGNPLESIVEASRILPRYGITIPAGKVLLAGAATPAVFVRSGDAIEAHCKGLGSVALNVA